MIYIAFRMAAVHLKNYFELVAFTFQTTVVINFFRRYKCQIHKLRNTESNWYVVKQKLKEIFLVNWLTTNAKLKTSGNFVELEGSQPQNNY